VAVVVPNGSTSEGGRAALLRRGVARLLATGSLLTPLGVTVLLVASASWVVAAVVGWIELLLAATAGLAVLALSGLFTVGTLQVRVDLAPSRRRLVEGGNEEAEVAVRLRNTSGVPTLWMNLEVAVGDGGEDFDLEPIAGHGEWAGGFTVAAARRGVVAIGPATTVRGDPLRLLERRVTFTDVSWIYIHPATVRLAPLGTGLLRDLEGRTTAELSMSDLNFHALRDYVPGDDRRHIHWRTSARTLITGDKLAVRQFQDTRRTQLLVVVDGDRSAYRDPEEFELAIRVGASISVRAVADDLDLTLLVADQQVRRRGAGQASEQAVLDACARAGHTRRRLPELIGDGTRHAPDLTFAVVVTGPRTTSEVRRAASRVPRHVRTVAVRVDPAATRALDRGGPVSVVTLTRLEELRALLGKESVA
jgi:uncharacterized protein (DUF58 family)